MLHFEHFKRISNAHIVTKSLYGIYFLLFNLNWSQLMRHKTPSCLVRWWGYDRGVDLMKATMNAALNNNGVISAFNALYTDFFVEYYSRDDHYDILKFIFKNNYKRVVIGLFDSWRHYSWRVLVRQKWRWRQIDLKSLICTCNRRQSKLIWIKHQETIRILTKR